MSASILSSLSALFAGGGAARFALLIFAASMVLLLPFLLPELSPARMITPEIVQSLPVVLLALLGAAMLAWRYPGGATGMAAALLVLAVVHVARMGSKENCAHAPIMSKEPVLVRLGLAAAVVLGAAGALQRWPGPRSGFLVLAGAALAHVVLMFAAASGHCEGGGVTAASTAFPAADAPVFAPANNTQSPSMRVSLQMVPESPRSAPMTATLEEHMVKLRAPPGQATVNWNAPAYGGALGMGTRAALGSFKSDVSDMQQRIAAAGGADV
jgi:hypothetical protein